MYSKKYYQDHKKYRAMVMRKYYQVHKIERAEYDRKYRKTLIGYLRLHFYAMKYRCNNPNFKQYKDYGGRGIKCLFKTSNEFVDYVINELKTDPRELTIDRIDNDGDYEKGNIRFVTQAENNNNKRRKNARIQSRNQRNTESYRNNISRG